MRIAVTGATGFVGRLLLSRLAGHEVIALSRSEPATPPSHVTWKKTDLFSAESTFSALSGVHTAFYLVHSMMPSTRLFQGTFHDTDLILADNFARACVDNGVKHIVYLGGLVPSHDPSPHLASRHEVEGVLRATGIPVTVLRAGMIVGPEGSSFEILRTLVGRLPMMILPRWTGRNTQAVFIDDVLSVLTRTLEDPALLNQTLDLVNGESLTYERLLKQTAQVLGVRRSMLRVPIDSTGFSKLWITLFARANYSLVSPLVDSLRCDLPASEPSPLIAPWIRYTRFQDMLVETLRRATTKRPASRTPRGATKHSDRNVRSVQRLPPVLNQDASWIARAYMHWLPGAIPALLRVKVDGVDVRFCLPWLRKPLLELKFVEGRFDHDRQKLYIVGGLLSRTTDTGWLEFRQVKSRSYTLAAIHDFVPALPWLLYLLTQAPVHKIVMTAFGRHLAASSGSSAGVPALGPSTELK